jgi:hypothetical protein
MRAGHRFRPSVESCEARSLLRAMHPWAAAAVQAANTPPVILQTTEVIQNKAVVAFQVQFTKPVNAAPLFNLGHYALFDQAPRNPFGRSAVPLASATYDPVLETLTLTPAAPVPAAPYLLTSPNPNDRSTDFITDAQGRPLLTASKEFDVYFQPHGVSLRNLVLTGSSIINHETGASFIIPALASIRSDLHAINQESGLQIVRGGIAGGSLATLLLLKVLS